MCLVLLESKDICYKLPLLVGTCRLLIIFANSLDQDQDRQNSGSDLDLTCLTLIVFLKEFFEKVAFEKNQQKKKKHTKLPSRQRLS